MIEITGNIWDFWDAGEWVCITTNGIVKANGCAVMGAGVAKEAAQRLPALPRQLGWKITNFGNHVYVFLQHRVITFPTKNDWRDPSSMELISESCRELRFITAGRIYLPRPGCKNGGLSWTDVKPVLEQWLPEEWFIVVSLV